jgi:hypothetical protein
MLLVKFDDNWADEIKCATELDIPISYINLHTTDERHDLQYYNQKRVSICGV